MIKLEDESCPGATDARISGTVIACGSFSLLINRISPNPTGVFFNMYPSGGGQNSNQFSVSGLTDGEYEIDMQINGGQSVFLDTITLRTLDDTDVFLVSTANASCGNANGSVEVGVTLGGSTVPGATGYTFNWSDGVTGTGPIRNNLASGNYSVTAVGSNCNCGANTSFTIGESGELTSGGTIISFETEFCGEDPAGEFIFNETEAAGTGGTITYLWEQSFNGTNWSVANQGTNNGISYDPFGSTVTRFFRRGAYIGTCGPEYSNVVTHTVYPAIVVNVAVISSSTCGNSDGELEARDFEGGVPPFSFAWSNGGMTQRITNVPAGTYTVTVTDDNGCTAEDTGTMVDQTSNLTEPGTFASPPGSGVTEDFFVCNQETYVPPTLAPSPATCSDGATPIYEWYRANNSTDFSQATALGHPFVEYSPGIVAMGNMASFWRAARCACDPSPPQQTTERQTFYVSNLSGSLNTNNDDLCEGESTNLTYNQVNPGYPANATYIYDWSHDGNASGSTVTVSPTTTTVYTVTVTDGLGCTDVQSVLINVTEEPNPDIRHVNQFTGYYCDNEEIRFSLLGSENPNATYTWTFDRDGFYNPVPATATGFGPHFVRYPNSNPGQQHQFAIISVTVTENGCVGTDETVAIIYTYPDATVTATDASCSLNNGTITVDWEPNPNQTGPNSGIEFSIDNGDSWVETGPGFFGGDYEFSDLAPGTYQVLTRYEQAPDCDIFVGEVSIADQPGPVVNGLVINVDCSGASTGSISAFSNNSGTEPFSFTWADGPTGAFRNSLPAGNYTVTITDANNCEDSRTFTVTEPDFPLDAEGFVSNPLCTGQTNGSINLGVTGGTPGYSYRWSTGATTMDLNNIGQGNYLVTVTDANGCEEILSFSLSDPEPLTVTEKIVDVICFGEETGSISLSPDGGTLPYSFIWGTGETTPTRQDLSAGSYDVTIVDANGCPIFRTYIIGQPEPLVVAGTPNDPGCAGENTGSISLSVSGGTPIYTYSWNTGATTPNLNNVTAGDYAVTVTDANGCEDIASFTLGEPSELTVFIRAQTFISCNGDDDAEILVEANGGSPEYSFLWNTGATTPLIQDLVPGVYSVTVTDKNGCTATLTETVTEPPLLVVDLGEVQQVSCADAQDGLITITTSGGTPGYTYSWNSGQTTPTIENLGPGTYTVVVRDSRGCAATLSQTISEPDELLIGLADFSNVTCNGDMDGAIDMETSGGTPPYNYLWNNGATTQDLENLSGDIYSVTVTDANGCTSTDDVTIGEPSDLVVTLLNVDDVSCAGAADGTLSVLTTGGTPGYTFAWSNGDNTAEIGGLAGGEYTVTVTDANGCTETLTQTVAEPTDLVVTLLNVDNVSCAGAADGTLSVSASGGTPGYTYAWSNGDNTA
ncbi:MAG: SprB repeat-containing protein, partial [Bacteroidota bacterium]